MAGLPDRRGFRLQRRGTFNLSRKAPCFFFRLTTLRPAAWNRILTAGTILTTAVTVSWTVALPAEKNQKPVTVSSIRITGNKAIPTDEIRSIMLTTTRSSFMGTGLFAGAQRPYVSDDFEKDIALIKKLYTFKGYFSTVIDTTVVRKDNRKKVDISIRISENAPARIDALTYSGIDRIPADLQSRFTSQSRLKTGDIFSVEKLIMERDRSIEFFRDNGYALFNPDSVRIRVDTTSLHTGIHFRLSLPGKVAYGPVRVVVHHPIRKDDETKAKRFTRDSVAVTIHGKQKFNENIFVHSVAYRPGKQTQYSLEQRTLQNFGATNLFSSISIENDSLRNGSLYTTIHLDPSPKHLIEPKLLVDNRYGDLFVGSALSYENRNLLGGGEQFRLSAEYGTQTTTNNNLLENLNESDFEKVRPYEMSIAANLVMPVLKKQGAAYTVATEYSQSRLPVLLSSRKGLVRTSYTTRPTTNSRLNFDFFEIELTQKDSLRGFRKLFVSELASNIGIDPSNETAVSNGIDSLLQRRVSQTFRLQYNYSNRYTPSTTRKTIWNLATTAEESGSLFWLIDKYVDTANHSGFSDTDPQVFGTAYSQYVKLDSQVSFAKDLTPDRQLAGRLTIGYMTPYGKSNTTPEDRRFYAGGANSMRGWVFNTLGPGKSSSKAASNFGADIKLEVGMEYRMKFFKFLGQPSGVTFFTDIGNIWDRQGPYALTMNSLTRDFAWDVGAGLRLGSPIGPFRFDFAWKKHDPSSSNPWKLMNWDLRNLTFNFGIGETF